MLEQSHERQLANPAQGAQLGRLAIRLAGIALESTLRRAFRVCGLKIRPFPVA